VAGRMRLTTKNAVTSSGLEPATFRLVACGKLETRELGKGDGERSPYRGLRMRGGREGALTRVLGDVSDDGHDTRHVRGVISHGRQRLQHQAPHHLPATGTRHSAFTHPAGAPGFDHRRLRSVVPLTGHIRINSLQNIL
jgi:hypothetical protein